MRASHLLLLRTRQGTDTTPASIETTGGTPQSQNCGAAYAALLVATVKNAGGVGLPAVSVTFTAPASGASGTFAGSGTNVETVLTDGSGVATSSAFTANGTGDASAYNVVTNIGALTCNFSLTNNWTPFAYVASLNPVVWYKHSEVVGVTCVNSGSAGAAADGIASAVTFGQTGILGANTAVLLDGVNSIIVIPNVAALANLTDWEAVFLIKPSNAGESNFGAFFYWGNGVSEPNARYNGVNALTASVFNTLLTEFRTITTSALANNIWQLLFVSFANTGDRKIHIRKGVAGAVSELGYAQQDALTGTYRTPTSVLNLFNATLLTITFAGLGGGEFYVSGNLTPTQRTNLTQLIGV